MIAAENILNKRLKAFNAVKGKAYTPLMAGLLSSVLNIAASPARGEIWVVHCDTQDFPSPVGTKCGYFVSKDIPTSRPYGTLRSPGATVFYPNHAPSGAFTQLRKQNLTALPPYGFIANRQLSKEKLPIKQQ
jgi:hypothetical protein